MARILVIEDSPTQAVLFASILETAGFQVEQAARLSAGLERSQRDRVDMRTAALMEGIQRVAEAKLLRGLFP